MRESGGGGVSMVGGNKWMCVCMIDIERDRELIGCGIKLIHSNAAPTIDVPFSRFDLLDN